MRRHAVLLLTLLAALVTAPAAHAQTIALTPGPDPVLSAPLDYSTLPVVPADNACEAGQVRAQSFTVTAAVTGRYRVTTATTDGPTATTAPRTSLSLDTTGEPSAGVSVCSKDDAIDETNQSTVVTTLTAGVAHPMRVSVPESTPGDAGVVQIRLQKVNDTRDTAQRLPYRRTITNSLERAANDYTLGSACNSAGTTANGGSGDVVYRFQAPRDGTYKFRVRNRVDSTQDLVLTVARDLPDSGEITAPCTTVNRIADDDVGTGETLSTTADAGERLWVVVDAADPVRGAAFEIDVTEERDEGGTNDTPATAAPARCARTGTIAPEDDRDFYDLGALAPTARVSAMFDRTGHLGDLVLRATSATDTLDFDDDDGSTWFGEGASVIAGAPAASGGSTYLRASAYSTSGTVDGYELTYAVQTGSPVAEAEPNGTVAAATPGTDVSGTLSGAAPSTDTDVYRFTAEAGTLLFLALDGDPTNDASPLDAKLDLLGPDGELLAKVNDASSASLPGPGAGLDATRPSAPAEGIAYYAPVTGTYYARVAAGGTSTDAYHAGDYTLSIARNCTTTAPPDITVTTASLPGATLTTPYQAQLAASGGSGPYRFGVSAGTLPPGLKLATDGTFSGTPEEPGDFTFTVLAEDAGGFLAERDYTVGVDPAVANDFAAGAEVLQGAFPLLSTTVDLRTATGGSDPVSDCQGTVGPGVWYRFTPARSGSYQLTTAVEDGTATERSDTVLAAYTSTGGASGPFTQVACNDDLDYAAGRYQSRFVTELTAQTTYWIVAQSYGADAIGADDADVQVRIDRLTPDNDTVAEVATLPLRRTVSAALGYAADNYRLGGGCQVRGTFGSAPGPDVVYRFTAPSAGDYTFRARSTGPDTPLVLTTADALPAGTGPSDQLGGCIAADVNPRQTRGNGEALTRGLTAGQELFVVLDTAAAPTGGESMVLLEAYRARPEQEANGTPGTATPAGCELRGAIDPADEVDFFRLPASPAGGKVYAMMDGSAAMSDDADLRVTSATDTLEYDLGDGDFLFSKGPVVAGVPVAATGDTFLRVNAIPGSSNVNDYRLLSVVQPGTPTAEVEPNGTRATATAGTYVSGGLGEPGDVDHVAFTAKAGDLLFVALDADPARANQDLDARLGLLAPDGTPLAGVDGSGSGSDLTPSPGTLTGETPNRPSEALAAYAPVTGTYSVRAEAVGGSGSYVLSIARNCRAADPAITVGPDTLPDGDVDVAYSAELSASGGSAPRTLGLAGGALPAGLTLSGTTISGTPTAAGTSTFTVQATDDDGYTGSRTYTVTIAAKPVPSPQPTASPSPTAAPTRTPAPTPTPDTTKPKLSGLKVSKTARLAFTVSEPAAVRVTLTRKQGKKYKRAGKAITVAARAGRNTVALKGAKKRGRYRVTLVATDAAGNRSAGAKKRFRRR